MFSKIFPVLIFSFIANVFGAGFSEYVELDIEMRQFFWSEILVQFFVIYLPLIFVLIILDTKKVISIKSSFVELDRLTILTVAVFVTFLLGYFGYFLNINLFLSKLLF